MSIINKNKQKKCRQGHFAGVFSLQVICIHLGEKVVEWPRSFELLNCPDWTNVASLLHYSSLYSVSCIWLLHVCCLLYSLERWYEMQWSLMVKLSLYYKSKSPRLLLVCSAVMQDSKPHGCRCWNPCNLTTLLKGTMKWRHKCTFTVSFSRFVSRWAMKDLVVQ